MVNGIFGKSSRGVDGSLHHVCLSYCVADDFKQRLCERGPMLGGERLPI